MPGLPQLTTLRLEYICLPEMVTGLADKCPHLQELSFKDSEKITDREVPEIRRCLRLRSLNISGTSVTGESGIVLNPVTGESGIVLNPVTGESGIVLNPVTDESGNSAEPCHR